MGRNRGYNPVITFWVDVLPAAQGSKKHVGRGLMVEANKNLPAWRKAIETTVAELHKGEPIDEPVIVRADFYLPKPKKPRWLTPATALDTDKLQRALGDGMEKGGLLRNDARIITWVATKHYAKDRTGCQVTVVKHGTTAVHIDFQPR